MWFSRKQTDDFTDEAIARIRAEPVEEFLARCREEDRRWAVEQAVIGGTPTEQIAARAEAILDYIYPMREQR